MSFRGLLNKTVTIERATASTYGWGEVWLSWATVATNVKCAVQPARPSSTLRDFGYQLEADFEAYFAAGTDIRPKTASGARDRVLLDSEYYEVLGVMDIAGRGKGLRVYLRREA